VAQHKARQLEHTQEPEVTANFNQQDLAFPDNNPHKQQLFSRFWSGSSE
jgi:hypothetical protein